MATLQADYGYDDNNRLFITTPRGTIIQTVSKDGSKVKAELVWDPGFGPRWTGKFGRAQIMIDETVLKGIEKYTPLRTSMMIQSARLGTTIGSGKIVYLAPYARKQYFLGREPGTSEGNPLRGRLWFERWKAVGKDDLLRRVKVSFGGN
ncbi:MAG: hypothetical protein ABFD29_10490 [Anaerolineaceae bacterium]